MKKQIAVFITAFLLLGVLKMPISHASSVKYRVHVKNAYLLTQPAADSDAIAQLKEGDCVYADGFSENERFVHVFVNSIGMEGWLYAPQLTLEDEKIQGTDSISIFTMPLKTVYVDSEESFDDTGLRICLEPSDGSPARLISGYCLYVPSLKTPGKKTVYVTYRPNSSMLYYTTSFEITVISVPLLSLSVETPPIKPLNSYVEEQTLDLTGLTLRLKYTADSEREDKIFTLDEILNDPDFTITGCHNETQGTRLTNRVHTVNISYKYPEISCSFSVSAAKRELTALTVIRYPDSTTMYTGQTVPDLTGLIVRADFNNGISKELTPDNLTVIFDPSTLRYGEGNMVEVKYSTSYGTMSVFLNYTYAVYEAVGIKLKTPEVMTYILGEPIDLTEYKVFTEYTNGDLIPVAAPVFGKINYLQTGAQTLTVTSGIYSASFTIYITPFYRKGDINNDGNVTAADARLALRQVVGLIDLQNKPLYAADVDRDGSVTAADARLILRAAVGLEDFLKHLR